MYAMIPVLWQNVKIFTVDSRNPSHDYKDFPRSLLPLRAAGVNPAPSGRPCLVFSAIDLCVSRVRSSSCLVPVLPGQGVVAPPHDSFATETTDRKSTRLNSSHLG